MQKSNIEELIIYGNGDFAKLMYYYFEKDSNYQVIAFCVNKSYIKESSINDLPVVAYEDIENIYLKDKYKMFVAVGYSNMRSRKKMYDNAKSKGYSLVNYISSSVDYDDSIIMGDNNVILSNVIIEPFVTIGNNNIIWTATLLCHNATIKDHSFLAAQSLVGGFSTINNNCFLGFNVTIAQNITLAKETFVGAKSLILQDTEAYFQYVGIPAKKTMKHEGIKIL